MDLAGFEPAAFRMQSGRATTALKTHGCEILTWIHRPRIELGSLPWQGSILPLDQRCNDSEVIDVRYSKVCSKWIYRKLQSILNNILNFLDLKSCFNGTKSQAQRTLSDCMESPGIDPGASRMLSERSTIWASLPFLRFEISLSEGIRFDHCRKDTISWVSVYYPTKGCRDLCGKHEFVRDQEILFEIGWWFRVSV